LAFDPVPGGLLFGLIDSRTRFISAAAMSARVYSDASVLADALPNMRLGGSARVEVMKNGILIAFSA